MSNSKVFEQLYRQLIRPQFDRSPVNYATEVLYNRLEEEHANNPDSSFWAGFESFIELKRDRLSFEKKSRYVFATPEDAILFEQEPHKVLDILTWLRINPNKRSQNASPTKTPKTGKQREIKDRIKFKIGLKFATGEAQKTYRDCNKNASETARKLGFKSSDHGYISFTISNTKGSPKNIYSDHKLMNAIYEHCKTENIEVVQPFKNNLPTE